jgi:transcriptional regulator with XRE-family HTH domain|tara:strand:- start:28690 stop:29127 length:438 start_codon:yes stop_codon:yes gene_type:complete
MGKEPRESPAIKAATKAAKKQNENFVTEGTIREHVGRAIREIRMDRGWSQTDLAAGLNIAYQYLQRIEGGEVKINLEALWTISQLLECSMGAFFMNVPTIHKEVRDSSVVFSDPQVHKVAQAYVKLPSLLRQHLAFIICAYDDRE